MNLKSYLINKINKNISELETDLKENKKSSRLLGKVNLEDTKYSIILLSSWKGEKPVEIFYKGTLKDAIKKAEEKFKKRNNRGDIQADYFAGIQLGNKTYKLPEKYWRRYVEKDND